MTCSFSKKFTKSLLLRLSGLVLKKYRLFIFLANNNKYFDINLLCCNISCDTFYVWPWTIPFGVLTFLSFPRPVDRKLQKLIRFAASNHDKQLTSTNLYLITWLPFNSTRQVPLVGQELLNLTEHICFSGVQVAQFLFSM